jgi:hypothetical protein
VAPGWRAGVYALVGVRRERDIDGARRTGEEEERPCAERMSRRAFFVTRNSTSEHPQRATRRVKMMAVINMAWSSPDLYRQLGAWA